jgi:hypothetical protein
MEDEFDVIAKTKPSDIGAEFDVIAKSKPTPSKPKSFFDPFTQEATARYEAGKTLAPLGKSTLISGAQIPFNIASTVSGGRVGGETAKALESEYEKVRAESPTQATAGQLIAGSAVPGGVMGAGFKYGRPILGATLGGATTSATGYVPPERGYEGRVGPALFGGTLGAALGTAGPLVAKGLSKARDVVSKAIPGEFKAGAEELRRRLSGVAQEISPTQQEISALERGRVPGVAAERAAERDIRGVQSRVQTELENRTKQAEAAEQKALQQVAPEKITDEQLGGFIQPKGRENVERLKGTRQTEAITNIKDPAFERARSREAKGEAIENFSESANQFKEVIAEIEKQIERVSEPYRSQLRARYASIRGNERPLTEAEKRVEQLRAATIPGYQPRSVATDPMTLDQAEFLRRMLKDKDLSKVEGFAAIDPFRMNELGDKLRKSMESYEPKIAEYIAEYERRSVPVTKALAGKGERAIETDISKEPNVLFSEDKKAVANYYLDGTAQRASRLLDLVGGKSPEVTRMVAGNIRSKIENLKTSEEVRDFVQKNEGLLSVFPEVRQSTEALIKAKEAVEKASKMKNAQTKKLGEALGVPSTTTKITPESASALKKDVNNFLYAIKDAAPQQIVGYSKKFIEQLEQSGRLSTEQYRSLFKQIQDIEKSGLEQQEAAKKVRQVMLGLASVGGAYGVARTASGLLGL